jgi:VanZ family protein
MAKSKWVYWLPPIAWMIFLFVLSSLSFQSYTSDISIPNEDKIFHAGLFGMLSILFFFALYYERRLPVVKAALLALLITAAYGAFDEFHQSFTPGRMPDIRDWFADVAGGTLAFIACLRRSPVPKPPLSDEQA